MVPPSKTSTTAATPAANSAFEICRARQSPNAENMIFTILKNTKIPGWENAVLGIGFQFFNFFNHPNFGLPNTDSSNTGFGQISYMESPPPAFSALLLGAMFLRG